MKRRSFFGVLGALAAAPALPAHVYEMALKGDTTAAIFWLKGRASATAGTRRLTGGWWLRSARYYLAGAIRPGQAPHMRPWCLNLARDCYGAACSLHKGEP